MVGEGGCHKDCNDDWDCHDQHDPDSLRSVSGVMYTSTPYRTYAITNQVTNGAATGTTMVTKSSSTPSIDFPIVFGSYLFRSLSQAKWENKCPNHCAFLFSAGLGLNLGAKTADLAGGPSFQLGGFIFTPVAVGARQNHLLDGV